MSFAERYPDEKELCNALHSYGSWHVLTQNGLTDEAGANELSVAGAPLPEGVYRTITADPPWRYGHP